jgi:hypothetical protein
MVHLEYSSSISKVHRTTPRFVHKLWSSPTIFEVPSPPVVFSRHLRCSSTTFEIPASALKLVEQLHSSYAISMLRLRSSRFLDKPQSSSNISGVRQRSREIRVHLQSSSTIFPASSPISSVPPQTLRFVGDPRSSSTSADVCVRAAMFFQEAECSSPSLDRRTVSLLFLTVTGQLSHQICRCLVKPGDQPPERAAG